MIYFNKTTMTKLFAVLAASICLVANAETFPANTKYDVCFTPGGDCTTMITNEINHAKKSIHVQAYSFTSAPIAKAIADAKKKGIDVRVILDKSQIKNNGYSSAQYLINQNVPIWIDYKPAIAHNKVIILDDNTVITGSFNFTKAAQNRNSENVLVIHDAHLAKLYLDNWMKRETASTKIK